MKFYGKEEKKFNENEDNKNLEEDIIQENDTAKPEEKDEIQNEVIGNNETQKVSPTKQNKKEIKQEEKVSESNKRKIIVLSTISFVILLALMIAFTGFALLNINNTKIMSGVSINGIDVKGLSTEEAEQKMKEQLQNNIEKDIKFKADNFEYSIKLSQIEVEYNINKAIQEAYNVGRSGNIFTNNFDIIKSMLMGTKVNLEFSYSEELLDNIISDMSVKVPDAVEETSYYIEDSNLIITKGKPGNSINKDRVKNDIINRISNINNEEINVELIYEEPNKIDIDKIYSEVYTEAQNAYYTKEPFEIFPHINGVDFDVEAAKEIIKEDKQEYEIPLKITVPEITTDKIGTEAFPDLLSSFSTRYDASQTGRSKNLRLAAEKIDGTVVMPGEVFSYNKTVGERTIAEGYTEAAGYAGGKVVPTLGGGICQISSTLYDAVVYANLDIVERRNHMFLTSYVGAGKDATVVYGSIDFKFKNTRNYPIMIKSSVKNGVAKMDIYGIKEEVEYQVEISTKILSYIPYGVTYETNNSLGSGKEKVVQNGMNGAKSITYKILKLNGQQVSSTVLSTDTYDPMNKIIQRGPKANQSTTSKPNKKEENKEITKKPNNSESTTKPNDTTNQSSTSKPTEEGNDKEDTTQNTNNNTTQKPINDKVE